MSLIKVKSTVRPRSLTILAAAANAAQLMGLPVDVVVTSGEDGKHMDRSKHYTGDALDLRSKTISPVRLKRAYLAAILERLGPKYSGILEHVGKPNEHFHIQVRKS